MNPKDRREPPVLTIKRAAEIAHVGINRMGAAVRNGDIPSIKIGRRRVVIRAKLEEILRGKDE